MGMYNCKKKQKTDVGKIYSADLIGVWLVLCCFFLNKYKNSMRKDILKMVEIKCGAGRIVSALEWICPECGNQLVECSAREEINKSYSPFDRGRKCTNCDFKCVMDDDWGAYGKVYPEIEKEQMETPQEMGVVDEEVERRR